MTGLTLNILVIPTYNSETLGIADASTYPISPVSSPTIEITVPSFGKIILPFNINDFNLFTSTSLGITEIGDPLLPLPDGIYYLTYSVSPAYENFVNKTFMRIERIQEKFDSAFMKLDMMECDRAIKKQQKEDLNSVYFLIQGSLAAANNCAVDVANKLYKEADRVLSSFIKRDCGCSGNNFK